MKTAEDIVREKNGEMISVSPDTTIEEAVTIMVEKKIGAILVKSGEAYTGIWTERDLMRNIIQPGFDSKSSKISEMMDRNLHSVPHISTMEEMNDKFLGLYIRHLLIEKDGKFIGLLSAGDVTRAGLVDKEKKFKELNSFVSWEYYENWKWGKKSR